MTTALIMLAAVLLDRWLGEPRRAHPLVGFGRMAVWIETRTYANRRLNGVIAWAACSRSVGGGAMARAARGACVDFIAHRGTACSTATLGLRSLGEHAQPVAAALGRMISIRHGARWVVW